MKKTIRLAQLAFVSMLILTATSCKKKSKPTSDFQAYAEFINAYPQGLISKEGNIKIVLAKNADFFAGVNEVADAAILQIEPKIEGTLRWSDAQMLVFTPDANFEGGKEYQVTFHLNKIWKNVPSELHKFLFNLKIKETHLSIEDIKFRAINPKDLRYNTINGTISSTDVADLSDFQNLLQATQNGSNLKIRWQQNAERTRHDFVIDSVLRTEEASVVNFIWGEKMALAASDFKSFTVPSLSDFKVLGTSMSPSGDFVSINFSDPLAENQSFTGLITLEDERNLSFSLDNTELRVYFGNTITGPRKLSVHPGIKNVAGFAFKEMYEVQLTFEDLKPAVELIGKGNIIPQSGKLIMPFKAVNLSTVDVYVIKIFTNNIPYFLQNNSYDGDNNLKRVGRPVVYQKVKLNTKGTNLKRWNTFSVDLSKLMKPEPGAIYRVEIKFRQQYSLFECEGEISQNPLVEIEEGINTDDYDRPSDYYWDDYYDYDYWDEYDYKERDNPCHMTYYMANRGVARNILATNLALTIKGGDVGQFTAFVTDLETSSPLNGVQVEFLNYQNQRMTTVTTGNDGSATTTLKGKPFLAVARAKGQFAYLRIDDGSSLSLSNFDVSGTQVKKGLKGFIYAERSVWRPGDSIHTNFMLEDAENTLPDNHPVIFEVRDPNGKTIERQIKTTHTGRIYSFPFATAENATTGIYTATVRVGTATTTKSLRVETIKPNRLKINLDFDTKVLKGNIFKANLNVNWLTGATAKNLKADVNLEMRQMKDPFEKHKDYRFFDEAQSFYPTEKELFNGTLDNLGNVKTNMTVGNFTTAPGMLEAVFVTRVFEPGGDISIDRSSRPYAPFPYFVGMKTPQPTNSPWLETDKPIRIQTVTVDADGKPVNRKLNATVYAIDWSWWWSSGRHSMANYLYSSYARTIHTQSFETNSGKGSFDFSVKYPNWGNYMVRICDDASGHCTSEIIYIDWSSSRDRSNRANVGAPTMLTFKADKEDYEVGDVAKISIPTSSSGRLLVSIETGSRVLKHMWVDAQNGQTQVDIPITADMTPNVYAFVNYIQPYAKTTNDLPIRLYGVIPLLVNHEATKIKPVIKTASEWQPNQQASITITEENGKAMTYTLAVVDEGLLDITKFKTPDPWKHFYQREALGIKTWDFFDDVLGAFGGKIEGNFAVGGDAELDLSGKKRLNRFTPVVKTLGPFTLKEGQTATHQIDMPNYIGSVRVMAVARQNSQYGHAEKAVPVRKALMVLATLPRVLSPNEEITLPVQVFSMKESIKQVKIQIKTNKLLKAETSQAEVKFNGMGDTLVYFKVKALKNTGKGVVDVTVTSGSETASYQVEIDLRNPNLPETKTQSFVLKPGEEKVLNVQQSGADGTRSVHLDISSLPNLNLQPALQYLMAYPHGCLEQTISKAFPQVYLADLINLSNTEKAELKKNINYALNKMMAMQLPSGGFSMWSGSTQSDFATVYAGHFMIEAEKAGYHLPGGLKQKWLKNERKAAQQWNAQNLDYSWNYDLQGYRLYVLALAGEAETGAMNRFKNMPLNKNAAWRLAAAYLLAGQPKVAQGLMNGNYSPRTNGNSYDPTFSHPARAAAMQLENFMLLKDDTKSFEQAVVLINEMNKLSYYTTQSASFSMIMLGKYLKNRKAEPLIASWNAGKSKQQLNQSKQFYSTSLGDFSGEFKIKNEGAGEIYVSINQKGVPLPGEESFATNQMRISTEYRAMDGSAINPEKLKQGTDIKVIVTISSVADRYKLHDMALSQIFPAGWEIMNTRLLELEGVSGASDFTHQDIRDDRVYTYFNQSTATRTYEIRLNAAYLGKFYFPGASVEAMYYPEIMAKNKGMWVEVLP